MSIHLTGIFFLVLLVFFYWRVIRPSSKKMLDTHKEDEDLGGEFITFFDDEIEEETNTNELKRKLEKKLDAMSKKDEDKIRYDLLLGKLKNLASQDSEEIGSLLNKLMESNKK